MSEQMMTKGERTELGQLIRKRERVMRAQAQERSAALLAEFDAQSAKVFAWDDDPVWAEAYRVAQASIDEANGKINEQCETLGIPKEFRPQIAAGWCGRRDNAIDSRRAELRRAAKSKIEALEKEAITKIERLSLEAQTEVIASGLVSEAAKTFLGTMPAMDTLMPPVEIGEIQSLIEAKRAGRPMAIDYLN